LNMENVRRIVPLQFKHKAAKQPAIEPDELVAQSRRNWRTYIAINPISEVKPCLYLWSLYKIANGITEATYQSS